MGLRNMIRNADMLGPPITLTLNGSETVKTYFGSIMTLVLFGATMASSVFFLIKFFDKSAPTVTETTVRYQDFQPIEFGEKKNIPIFFVRSYDDKPLPVDISSKIIRPKLTAAYNNKVNGAMTSGGKDFAPAPCKEVFGNPKYLDYFSDADNWEATKSHILDNGICFMIEKSDLHMLRSDNPNAQILEFVDGVKREYSYIFYGVQPCDVAKTGECLTKKYLVQDPNGDEFANSYIEFIFPKPVLNLQNSEKPVKKYWEIEEGLQVKSFDKYPVFYYSHYMSVIEDESQYLGELKRVESFINLDTKPQATITRQSNEDTPGEIVYECDSRIDPESSPKKYCDYFMTINFVPDRKETNFNRRYTQFPDLLSQIGGIYSLLIGVFSFINGIVLNIIKSNYYIAGLFPMLPLKSFTCKKKKYNEVSKQVDSDIQKHNKYWNDLGEEAVEMVESSIDLAVLFHEICKIRVIANLLLDDKQKEMITLASFYQFKNAKEAKEDSERSKQEDSSTQMKNERKKRAKAYYEIKHRLSKKPETQTGENATESDQQLESRLARKIDEEIVKAYKELKLDAFQVHEDPEFDDFKRMESDIRQKPNGIQANQDPDNQLGESHKNNQNLDPENPENRHLLRPEDRKNQLEVQPRNQMDPGSQETVQKPSGFFNDIDEGIDRDGVRVKFSAEDKK